MTPTLPVSAPPGASSAPPSSVPAFGLGTFRLQGAVVRDVVRHALALGYRHIDTAQIYDNEADIGQAWSHSGVPRQDLFLTTKVWADHLGADKLMTSLKDSLHKLRTEQVDLALIHWPAPARGVPVPEFMGALAEAQAQGLTRLIGVSNFNVADMEAAVQAVGAQAIATHQIELHPFLQNRQAVAWAQRHGIHITSYMTLAYGQALHDPVVVALARERGLTPAQLVLAWAMQKGWSVIPSSTRPQNLADNLRAQALRLSESDMARIDALERGQRLVDPQGLAPAWD